jgi:heme/copper-type cytochrome/quinol oxidase subunit 4
MEVFKIGLDDLCRSGHLRIEVTMDMQRFLIGLGLLILLTGIAWPVLSRIGVGRLPGDIFIQRGGTSFYFPIVTCIVLSIVLSALMWLFNR